jgi:hypothetical protein
LELLLVRLGSAAVGIAGEHFNDEFPMISAPSFQAILDGGGVFADDADV